MPRGRNVDPGASCRKTRVTPIPEFDGPTQFVAGGTKGGTGPGGGIGEGTGNGGMASGARLGAVVGVGIDGVGAVVRLTAASTGTGDATRLRVGGCDGSDAGLAGLIGLAWTAGEGLVARGACATRGAAGGAVGRSFGAGTTTG
jgi:hypothetical protein